MDESAHASAAAMEPSETSKRCRGRSQSLVEEMRHDGLSLSDMREELKLLGYSASRISQLLARFRRDGSERSAAPAAKVARHRPTLVVVSSPQGSPKAADDAQQQLAATDNTVAASLEAASCDVTAVDGTTGATSSPTSKDAPSPARVADSPADIEETQVP